ncbi:TetR/AcrR family transcriptional regulator [Antrihabitans stalactiti]|uniref:TetR/AcrR family transcriptional regulator n=1 Tax=Antrihabitans stalactiti TaxID=2584121 RepID=A0A848KCY8_9NOCA|nr:TetR/AcrR family transcriptional regulator [Antrihabitans stalactiti]NMN95034.1 TetR/AcrR family transcriptional regulator [Antrihabitans stalactiti]
MSAPATRRTQAERRADTMGKLIDATIDAIAEVGYHRTSLGQICERAGISRGGLFRHFDSRLDVVVAAAEEVGRRHVERFQELRATGGVTRAADAISFARSEIRDRINTVWFELLVAARTDPDLRTRLAPVAEAMLEEVEELGQRFTDDYGVPPELAQLIITSLIHMFDGEAIFRATYPRPALEEARMAQVERLLEAARRK